MLTARRVGLAVAVGLDNRARGTDGRSDFQANHRERAVAMLDDKFAEENLPKTWHAESVADLCNAGAVQLHLFDAGTKEYPIRARLFDRVARPERIMRYRSEERRGGKEWRIRWME